VDLKDLDTDWIKYIGKDPIMLGEIVQAWEKDDIAAILVFLGNDFGIPFVFLHRGPLRMAGLFEKGLLDAYQSVRVNTRHFYDMMTMMFQFADADKMRAAGSSIPDQESFTLYRGVAGRGRARRVNGFSWTVCPHMAAWFAMRFSLEDPAVFQINVPKDQIMARLLERGEKEYLLRLPLPSKPKRLKPMPEPQKRRPDFRI